MRAAQLVVSLGVACAALFPLNTGAALPPGFVKNTIVGEGLTQPTALAFLPDGRLLVTERGGRIRVIQNDTLLLQPMLELQAQSSSADDNGLLGIAIDPEFPTNPYLYVFYTNSQVPVRNRVSRFTVAGNLAALASEKVVWQNDGPSEGIHQGGTVRFGGDGKLYISTGEQSNPDNAQSLANQHGKILRVNPDGSVPLDNPFHTPAAQKIWAYGFRNPFRFTIDIDSATLWIGDVGAGGPGAQEEINRGVAGGNFGWPLQAGPHCLLPPCPAIQFPAFAYAHDSVYCSYPDGLTCAGREQGSITMGPVYHATQFPPEYRGKVFLGDYANRWIGVFDQTAAVPTVEFFDDPPDAGTVVDFAVGPDGALYYVTFGLSQDGSTDVPGVHRILWIGTGNQPPQAQAAAAPLTGVAPLTVAFSSAGSVDPDGGPFPLKFSWTFGDGQSAIVENPQHVYAEAGAYSARLTVSDGAISVQSASLAVTVGGRPVPTIVSPLPGTTYNAGDVVTFEATAIDPDGPPLAASAFSWQVVLIHAGHTHPAFGPIVGKSGSITVPVTGHPPENTHYEIRLTVTDPDGLATMVSRRIDRNVAALDVDTEPTGIPLTVDGEAVTVPHTIDSLRGYTVTVNVPLLYRLNETLYRFVDWSDGGARQHQVVLPAGGLAVQARYEPAGARCGTVDTAGTPPAGCPVPTIVAPPEGTTYSAGDVITFDGTATDPDGTLDPTALSWRVVLVDGEQTHPVIDALVGQTSGNFTVPVSGPPPAGTYYEIQLSVTDADGLMSTVRRRVERNVATVELVTDPPGIQLLVDGESVTAPRTIDSLRGYAFNVGAPVVYRVADTLYRFVRWSDAGRRQHDVVVPANGLVLRATYERAASRCGTIDADGDQIPDGCDVCPVDPDAEQPDADADGVGDACDLCPDTIDHGGATLRHLRVVRRDARAADDRIQRLRLGGLALASFDPRHEMVELRLADGGGEIVRALIDPATAGARWKGRGMRWRFRSNDPAAVGGIEWLSIVPREGRLTVALRLQGRDLSGADAPQLAVTLRIGDDCWSVFSAQCRVRSRDGLFLCQ